MRHRTVQAILLAAGVLSGCGGGADDEDTRVRGDTLTVYMSVPAHGVSAAGGEAATAGAERALEEAGGRVAGRRVKLVTLPSTRPGDSVWDPGTVEANAKRPGDDPTAIAYIGELDLGGSAVSLPATNRDGVLQVSPADGLTSLTGTPPGRPRAGPERYYPEEVRTFVRLVPDDLELAVAMLGAAGRLGASRPAVVHTQGVSERELAGMLADRSRAGGAEPVAVEVLRDEGVAADVAEDLRAADTDAILLAGVRGPATSALLAVLAGSMPAVPVIASSGMAGFDPGDRAPRQTYVYTPIQPPSRAQCEGSAPAHRPVPQPRGGCGSRGAQRLRGHAPGARRDRARGRRRHAGSRACRAGASRAPVGTWAISGRAHRRRPGAPALRDRSRRRVRAAGAREPLSRPRGGSALRCVGDCNYYAAQVSRSLL